MLLRLFCGDVLVGEVAEAFIHQGTWFGMLRTLIAAGNGPSESRILQFIAFCEDFNRRCADEPPPDASEFDQYSELFIPGVWRLQSDDGTASKIADAPNFLGEEEISWIEAGGPTTRS